MLEKCIDESVMDTIVNNHIKVYARIKKENSVHKSRYEIINEEDCDILQIYDSGSTFQRKRLTFRFNKVFSASAQQDEIFTKIAKPIINNVFSGLNATIFAYGATGSGKTYTLTGSQNKFEERGLIPRTIEYIFQLVCNNMSNYMFFISYLEIYNEKAYDLLNPKQNFSSLEELPRVVVLEDEIGEAHFKNLCLKEVNTEKEAMQWLYLGDNNRTIAETPLNDYSSRSHCVFTVHVISKCNKTGNITRSKLNLVDLAGSERLHRMNLQGMTLNEARHINLSLHYLERVIQALSHRGKNHVPYRNSMMTFILRDSLGGNCLTAMLATLSLLNLNFEETISTCKFSQRVCLIKMDACVNLIANPEKEISFLRNELDRLKRQLTEKLKERHRKLTREEQDECKFSIKKFLKGEEDLKYNDPKKVRYYVEYLRDKISEQNVAPAALTDRNILNLEKRYQQIINQKDEQINALMNIYELRLDVKGLLKPPTSHTSLVPADMKPTECEVFEEFLCKSQLKNRYDLYVEQMNLKYRDAVKASLSLKATQEQIANVKSLLMTCKSSNEKKEERKKLSLDQAFYREQLIKMNCIKNDMEDLKAEMCKIKLKIMDDFKQWKSKRNSSPVISGYINSKKKFVKASPRSNKILQKSSSIISLSHDKYPPNCIAEKIPFASQWLQKPQLALQISTKDLENYEENVFCSFSSKVHSCSPAPAIFNASNEELEFDKSPKKHDCSQTNYDSVCYEEPMLLEKLEKSPPQQIHIKQLSLINNGANNVGNTANLQRLNICTYHQQPQAFYRKPLASNFNGQNFVKLNGHPVYNLQKISPKKQFSPIKRPNLINNNLTMTPRKENKSSGNGCRKFIRADDSPKFISYLKSIPLTGDEEVDEEIVKFYRIKYGRHELN